MALVGIVAALSGCSTVDPSVVGIRNDGDRTATVALCSSNGCRDTYDDSNYQLAPGESVEVNVSSRGVPNVYLVLDAQENRVGCLPIVMPEPTEGVVVLVSQHAPCVEEIDRSVPWPPS